MRSYSIRNSSVHGKGIFALRDFNKGELVGEYYGERITNKEAIKRTKAYGDHTMMASIGLPNDKATIIDAATGSCSLRFINHRCDNNVEFWQVGNRIFVYTAKKIQAGQELSLDYALHIGSKPSKQAKERFKCYCSSKACRGTMLGAYDV